MRTLPTLTVAALLSGALAGSAVAQDEVLPITTARVTQLLHGLAAERPMWARVKAMEDSAEAAGEAEVRAAVAADDAATRRRDKFQAYEDCSERTASPMPSDVRQHAMRLNQKLMALNEQQRAGVERMMESLETAAREAAGRGDMKTIDAARKAMLTEMAKLTGIPLAEIEAGDRKMRTWSEQNDATVEKACGPEPEAPESSEEEIARRIRSQRDDAGTDAIDQLSERAALAGARASGLPARDYAVLRERVAAFLAADGDLERCGSYKFADAEAAVLRQRLAEIRRYGDELTRTPSWNFDD